MYNLSIGGVFVLVKYFNGCFNCFLFFAIFLIISITPASAGLIGGAYGNDTNQSMAYNRLGTLNNETNRLNSSDDHIENDIDKIDGCMNDLYGDFGYINKRSGDFTWKVWKWPGIIKDIIKSVNNMLIITEKIQEPANRLKDNAQKLESLKTSSSDIVVTDVDLAGDANRMAVNLSKNLDTQVTAKNVQANGIKEGDIVQYLSHDQYPRYLIVANITPNTTAKKQTKGIGSPATHILFLKGPGNMIIPTNFDNYITLEFNQINPTTVLNSAMQIQNSNIEQIQADINSLNEKAAKYKHYGKILLYFAIGFGIFGAVIIVSGAFSLIGLSVAIPLAAVLGIVALILGIAGGTLYGLGEYYNGEANELLKMYNYAKEDLNQYTTDLNTTSMNVSTFNGVPIVKKPDIKDWKQYQFTLTAGPKHGTVLPGPGLQFLYGPDEGYIGTDCFTFQYSKNGKTTGLMVVNIRIDPIPVTPIPSGGT